MRNANQPNHSMGVIMDIKEWHEENDAFLIKIGQVEPKQTKPATKKDEE